MPHPTIIFDDGKGRLAPLTDLLVRPSISAPGAAPRRMFDPDLHIIGLSVPEPIRASIAERCPLPVDMFARITAPEVLVINGRAPLAAPAAATMKAGQVLRDPSTSDLIAAIVPLADLPHALKPDWSAPSTFSPAQPGPHDGFLITRPWHLRTPRRRLPPDRSGLAPPGRLCRLRSPRFPASTLRAAGDHDVFIAASATVFPGVCFDSTDGPILIDEHAVIRPRDHVGPVYIGPHSTVLERTLIKANTAIGPWCKVAGEIGGTHLPGFRQQGPRRPPRRFVDRRVGQPRRRNDQLQPAQYLRRSHRPPRWVPRYAPWRSVSASVPRHDPSAGRTTSRDLARLSERRDAAGGSTRHATGDHVKTAICTRIMTATDAVHGRHFAASGPLSGTVRRHVSAMTDSGTKPSLIEKFIEVAARPQ